MTLRAGDTVGRYRIVAKLGQGGMATVYRAFQASLQRDVALKVLRPGFSQDAEFRGRFEREAIAIARLRHPHIVQVFDFEATPDGDYVLAMEFLEGGTLMERLAQLRSSGRRIDRSEAVRIVGEVAEALGYAHEQGVVHRDVKPSNVMLTRKDWAVVTDFGIARILGKTAYTQTGVGMGTPEYMAPEQGLGEHVDRRADIYSLGVMAYELLSGRLPYRADTPVAVALAHIRQPLPRPSSVDPSIGPAIEKALLTALAKDPAARFDSAAAFAEALRAGLADDAAGAGRPTIGPGVPLRLAARPLRAGLVAALVVGASLVVASAFRMGSAPGSASATRPPPSVVATASGAAKAAVVTASPTTRPAQTPTAAPAATTTAVKTATPTAAPAATTTAVKTATPTAAPAPTSPPTAAPAPTPSAYGLGQTAVLKWAFDEESEIEVTVLEVIDPAQPSEGYDVEPGARYVAFRVLIKNRGPGVYDEYPSDLAEVLDTQGRLYPADASEPVAPGFDRLRIAPGAAIEGRISVELDNTVVVQAFLYTSSVFEGDTARWNVR